MSTSHSVPVEEGRRAVGYCRVSSDEQTKGYGLDVQADAVRQYALCERLRLVATLEDVISGTVPLAARPGLTEALDLVEESKADVVLVARQDRIAPDSLVAALVEREIEQAGGQVVYCEGTNGSDPAGQLARTVLHAISQYERQTIVARMAAGKARKIAEGGYGGGRPPIGYRAHGKALVPDEEAARLVRWVFERVAQDEWSERAVARSLDTPDQQGRRPLGRRWRPVDVHRILTRVDYKLGPPGAKIVDPRVWNKASAVLAARRKG